MAYFDAKSELHIVLGKKKIIIKYLNKKAVMLLTIHKIDEFLTIKGKL